MDLIPKQYLPLHALRIIKRHIRRQYFLVLVNLIGRKKKKLERTERTHGNDLGYILESKREIDIEWRFFPFVSLFTLFLFIYLFRRGWGDVETKDNFIQKNAILHEDLVI